jgi:hypothetical protein
VIIARDQVRPVALPTEAVDVPEIGGQVLVRGMDMPQMLAFTAARRAATAQRDGESAGDAAERSSGELVPLLLSMCVLAADGLPVYSLAEWRAFAVQHTGPTLALWEAAVRLSGQGGDAEKKT